MIIQRSTLLVWLAYVVFIAMVAVALVEVVQAQPPPEHVRCWGPKGMVVDTIVAEEPVWTTGPRCLPPCAPEDGYCQFRGTDGALYMLYRGHRGAGGTSPRLGDPCMVARSAVKLSAASAQCSAPVCGRDPRAPLQWIDLSPDLKCLRPAGVMHADGTCRLK